MAKIKFKNEDIFECINISEDILNNSLVFLVSEEDYQNISALLNEDCTNTSKITIIYENETYEKNGYNKIESVSTLINYGYIVDDVEIIKNVVEIKLKKVESEVLISELYNQLNELKTIISSMVVDILEV